MNILKRVYIEYDLLPPVWNICKFDRVSYIYVTDEKRGPDETPGKTTPSNIFQYIMVFDGLYGFRSLTIWF